MNEIGFKYSTTFAFAAWAVLNARFSQLKYILSSETEPTAPESHVQISL